MADADADKQMDIHPLIDPYNQSAHEITIPADQLKAMGSIGDVVEEFENKFKPQSEIQEASLEKLKAESEGNSAKLATQIEYPDDDYYSQHHRITSMLRGYDIGENYEITNIKDFRYDDLLKVAIDNETRDPTGVGTEYLDKLTNLRDNPNPEKLAAAINERGGAFNFLRPHGLNFDKTHAPDLNSNLADDEFRNGLSKSPDFKASQIIMPPSNKLEQDVGGVDYSIPENKISSINQEAVVNNKNTQKLSKPDYNKPSMWI